MCSNMKDPACSSRILSLASYDKQLNAAYALLPALSPNQLTAVARYSTFSLPLLAMWDMAGSQDMKMSSFSISAEEGSIHTTYMFTFYSVWRENTHSSNK